MVVHRAPGWVSSLQVAVLPGDHHTDDDDDDGDGDNDDDDGDDGDADDKNYADSLRTRILGPILVSYVYEVKGTYWLFGLCAASLLVTGIVTLAAFRCALSHKTQNWYVNANGWYNFCHRNLVPLEDQSLGGDSQDGATLPLTETIEKMEIDQEETEESEHLKQKQEGDP